MEISKLLNFIIAISFLFSLLSVFTSSITESLLNILKSRRKLLYKSISEVLNSPQTLNYADLVFNHPLIDALSPQEGSLPVSIDPKLFARAFVDVLLGSDLEANVKRVPTENNLPSFELVVPQEAKIKDIQGLKTAIHDMPFSDVRTLLSSIINNCADLPAFETALIEWYNTYMVEVTRRYKATITPYLFFVGLFVAISLNLNTLRIMDYFWKSPEVVAKQVEVAKKTIQSDDFKLKINSIDCLSSSDRDEIYNQLTVVLNESGIPFGYKWINSDTSGVTNKKKLLAKTYGDSIKSLNHTIDSLKSVVIASKRSNDDIFVKGRIKESRFGFKRSYKDDSSTHKGINTDNSGQSNINPDTTKQIKAKQDSLSKVAEEQAKLIAIYSRLKSSNTDYGQYNLFDLHRPFGSIGNLFLANILGWILTTLAITAGAPFWYVIIKNIIDVKQTFKIK